MKPVNHKKSFIAYIFLLIVFTGLSSCKKFVQINPAPNLITTNALFQSEGTALAAVSGVYAQLRTNLIVFTNGSLSIYSGLASDELYATTPNSNADPYFQNQLIPANTILYSQFYAHAYRTIYQTNAVIEGVMKSASLSQESKRTYTGEMKVIRSMMYFYLVNLFGDVPLVSTTDYSENSSLPRSEVNLIYDQIISDLNDARNLLSASYPSAGKVRVNKYAASALLARVYLFRKNWSKAEEMASEVINSGMYSLVASSSIENVFLKNSSETLWEVASPNEGSAVGEASAFIPSSTNVRPTYALTTELLGSFEAGDKRNQATTWVGKNMVNGLSYFYPSKYKQRSVTTGSAPKEYQVVLRLAEQYLIRSEARAEQDKLTSALEDLNLIRNRASLPDVIASTTSSVLTAIEKENQIEFFAEWGHRWLDLKRLGKADAVLGPIKGANWQTTDILWPIPATEINSNPFLTQNPGY
jgi:starch-binding outer membrane protein, SusD/RagB family